MYYIHFVFVPSQVNFPHFLRLMSAAKMIRGGFIIRPVSRLLAVLRRIVAAVRGLVAVFGCVLG